MILLFRQLGDLFFLVAQPVMVGDLSAQEPEVRVRSAAVCEAQCCPVKEAGATGGEIGILEIVW
jgi:hypothetical protein